MFEPTDEAATPRPPRNPADAEQKRDPKRDQSDTPRKVRRIPHQRTEQNS